ncbi:ABC transporter permease [Longimicrobium sp.]|uniref:ABC transporter permease n=1 Tax=Longimicrobium sp. TaxID=2029185 RepID=UPI003B3B1BAD
MLIKYPGLALVGGLGMAVAIAIGAGIFDVTSAIFYSTLPLDEGERVVLVEQWDAEANNQERHVVHDFAEWRGQLKSVQDLGAFRTVPRNLVTAEGEAEQVIVAEMTASGFRVARVPPMLGRPLVDGDEREGAPPVVVIAEEVWRTRFDSDPRIVGRQVRLGSTVHTVVGVMPPDFAFPVDHRFWVPLWMDPADYARRQGPVLNVFGRLAPGATMESAGAELEALGRRASAELPRTHTRLRPRVLPYTAVFADLDELWQVHGMRFLATLLLVVVCVNVAILVYARTAARQGEMAVRSALGASRRRIVAQLFAEALLLSAAAAVVGLLIARQALRSFAFLLPPPGSGAIPFWIDFGLSRTTVLYVAALAIGAAVIAGVVPAVQATGRLMQSTLHQLGGATGLRLGRTWTVLIVAQVAFAVAVLPAAVSNTWEFLRYGMAAPGFEAGEFLTVRLNMEREVPPTADTAAYDRAFDARYAGVQAELARRLEAEPGVRAVTYAAQLPGREPTVRVEIDGVALPPSTAGHEVLYGRVDPGFFDAFDIPQLAGRRFGAVDLGAASAGVIVNRSFVRRYLANGAALGRRIRHVEGYREGGRARTPEGVQPERWYEIVGVVDDFPNAMSPGTEARLYHPMAPGQVYPVSLAVRTDGDPAAFSGRLREMATALDPGVWPHEILPLDRVLRQLQVGLRVAALALALVTLSVLLLSAAGIYALMSFTVMQRRREIGIRTALGADSRRILRSIFSRAAGQLGAGLLVGMVVAGVLERASGGLLIVGNGAVLLPMVAALMMAVGLLAAAGPARRGLRIQPMDALRNE